MNLKTLHNYLKLRNDLWTDAWTISQACRTTAVSTRISDLRQKGVDVEHKQEGKKHYYRLRQPAKVQGELFSDIR